jgi:hypothetical protein
MIRPYCLSLVGLVFCLQPNASVLAAEKESTVAQAENAGHEKSAPDSCCLEKERTVPCICLRYPFFNMGGTYLYYAEQYEACEDENDCIDPTIVYYEAPAGEPGETCPFCSHRRGAKHSDVKLAEPKPAPYNAADFRKDLYQDDPSSPDPLKLDFSVGDSRLVEFISPRGAKIRAKIFLVRLKASDGEALFLAFGCEVRESSDQPDFYVGKVSQHGTHRYLYELDLGAVTYVVISSR